MTFQWPYLLFALALLPIVLAVYVFVQRRRRRYALRFTNLALLGAVAGPGPGLRRHIPPLLYLLSLSALLISLARPMAVVAVPRDQAGVMLVLDVSGSMAADDIRPNRLEAAKQATLALIEALPEGAQVGLVSFSGTASLRAPLGHDREAVRRALQMLAEGGGTAMGEGLHLALDELDRRVAGADGEKPPATIVLLSDGYVTEGRPVMAAAQRALEDDATVYTVGVGQRGATPSVQGGQRVYLDEATLQRIAETTGAEYFYAAEASELEQIYADLGSQVSWVEEQTEVTALVSALGAVLLLAGGLLSLLWLHRLP
ncbi:MAG: VWA domain-containing protein [Chloroflexota bacterium]